MRDAFAISVVIGMMVTVMGSMMAFFATGMAEDGVIPALRTGFVLGLGVGADGSRCDTADNGFLAAVVLHLRESVAAGEGDAAEKDG